MQDCSPEAYAFRITCTYMYTQRRQTLLSFSPQGLIVYRSFCYYLFVGQRQFSRSRVERVGHTETDIPHFDVVRQQPPVDGLGSVGHEHTPFERGLQVHRERWRLTTGPDGL